MRKALLPYNETDRLAALARYGILDTPSDAVLDGITQAAANLCEMPIALISLIDPSRQWFKSCVGMPVRETSRELAFCSHAILTPGEFMEVEDASQDERFRDNPLVTGEPMIRFYAGSPLVNSEGLALGTLCVIDDKPRRLSVMQRDGLMRLAQVVMNLLDERQGSRIAAINHVVEQAVRHGVVITDPRHPDNPITYVNRAVEVITGYSQPELIGRNCRLFQGQDTDASTLMQLREAITTHRPCTVVIKNYKKDGTMFWNELTISPIKDSLGNTVNYVGVQYDVTDRQIALERLTELADVTAEAASARAASDQWAQIVEDSVNEIFVTNARTFEILNANRAARANLGYSAEEIKQLMPWDFVEELTQENMQQRAEPVFSGARHAHVFETTHRRKDGSTYPVSAHVQLMATQNPPVYASIVLDLTERHRQEELINLRNRAIEAVDVGVSITDATQDKHPLVYVNQAYCDLIGYSADELLGSGISLLQKNSDHQPGHYQIQKALAEGEPVHTLIESTRKDGSSSMVELSLSPVHSEKGLLTHHIGISRDVTSKIEAEVRLHQTRKIEAIGRLSGGIAHDFNNLLSVINGNLEMLSMSVSDEEHCSLLAEAESAARMGARLTRRLLTFARQRQLEPVILNVNDSVVGTIELLNSTIGETITLSSGLSPDLWSIRADPSEVENTVVNLAINARDAMPDGGAIDISTRNVCFTDDDIEGDVGMLPGDYIQLSVSDTGCGMTEEVKARIFEPFFTTKEHDEGTGLGLASIHGFVHQSGGYIHVFSEVGQGTTFKLYLPRYLEKNESVPLKQPTEVKPSVSDARILVVEDNDMVLEMTINRLHVLGYRTEQASNGPEAIRYLKSNSDIDLVLSDIVMSQGMSGYDVAHWIQHNLPACKVLLTSGFSEQLTGGNALLRVNVPLLPKPYSLVELQQAVNCILEI